MPALISLQVPDRALLGPYEAALRDGWSPNTTRDVAPEQLAAIAADADAFLAEIRGGPGRIRLPDGREVDRIPGPTRWIFAEDRPERPFVGSINLRWQEDAQGRPMPALPEHVLGHIGYAVVPWKRRLGYATRALALLLDDARRQGLDHVALTTDPDNEPSQRVILANGGILQARFNAGPAYGNTDHLLFHIPL